MKSETEIQNAIELYADMVQKLCVLHMKQKADAEDVFQTVFLRYAQSKPFKDRDHEKAWIIKVTLNACKEPFRSWFHKHTDAYSEVEGCAELPTSTYYLLDALNKLPQKYHNVLYLFYYEGYKVKEIADITGKKENTIHTWLKRGKEMLRDILGGELDDFQ